MTAAAEALRPPSRTLLLLEGRAVQELGAFMLLRPWLAAAPRGDGHPVLVFRMDGNQPGVTEFAMQKAEAVASWHFSTAEMENAAKETPGFRNAPHVVTVPGGIPIFSADGTRFIGAVGVSGEAPKDDVACAEAGVTAAGLSLKANPAR